MNEICFTRLCKKYISIFLKNLYSLGDRFSAQRSITLNLDLFRFFPHVSQLFYLQYIYIDKLFSIPIHPCPLPPSLLSFIFFPSLSLPFPFSPRDPPLCPHHGPLPSMVPPVPWGGLRRYPQLWGERGHVLFRRGDPKEPLVGLCKLVAREAHLVPLALQLDLLLRAPPPPVQLPRAVDRPVPQPPQRAEPQRPRRRGVVQRVPDHSCM